MEKARQWLVGARQWLDVTRANEIAGDADNMLNFSKVHELPLSFDAHANQIMVLGISQIGMSLPTLEEHTERTISIGRAFVAEEGLDHSE